jgi:hypothetical protein
MQRIFPLFAFFAAAAVIVAGVLLAGCDPIPPSTTAQNAAQVESNQQRLQKSIPAPQLQTSLERQNLVERLERINQQNMSGFVYLLSYGRVVASYPIRGKVTSLNAYLMAAERPMNDPHGDLSAGSVMVEQPDYDGAYGKNADGVFFFTADTNAYVEWQGDYLFSDQPLKLNQEPMMVRNVSG